MGSPHFRYRCAPSCLASSTAWKITFDEGRAGLGLHFRLEQIGLRVEVFPKFPKPSQEREWTPRVVGVVALPDAATDPPSEGRNHMLCRHVERHLRTMPSPILPIGNACDWKNGRFGSQELVHDSDPLPPHNYCTEGRGRNPTCFWRRPMWSSFPTCPFDPCIDCSCPVFIAHCRAPAGSVRPRENCKSYTQKYLLSCTYQQPAIYTELRNAHKAGAQDLMQRRSISRTRSLESAHSTGKRGRIQVLLLWRRASIYFVDQCTFNGCTLYIRKYPAYA